MEALEFKITISPQGSSEPVVAFGDFPDLHPSSVQYATTSGSSQLSRLYVDLITGRPMPLEILLRGIYNVADILAAAFFVDRDLILSPKALTLVSAVDLAHALQRGGLAHVDRDQARLLGFLEKYLLPAPTNQQELSRRLQQAFEWIKAYVDTGGLPSMPRALEPPTVLDTGTNGFVLAEATGHPLDGIVDLYRAGFLRGVLFKPHKDRILLVGFKKSHYIQFNLEDAAHKLNLAGQALTPSEVWTYEHGILRSPDNGTLLPLDTLIQVFLRI